MTDRPSKPGRPNIFKDRDELVIEFPMTPGKPRRINVYHITRAGISWPTDTCPGYYCILGLKKDSPTMSGKDPLVLLAEGEGPPIEKFFERMTYNAGAHDGGLHCQHVYMDLREKNQVYEESLRKFVSQRNVKGIVQRDSSEFDNIEYAINLIKQLVKDHALTIRKSTILQHQIVEIKPENKSEIEDRFYAVAALARVLTSFQVYPWSNSKSTEFVGFSNFVDKDRDKGWDGSYQEFRA